MIGSRRLSSRSGLNGRRNKSCPCPVHRLLPPHTPEFTSDNIQTMSFDFNQYRSSEITNLMTDDLCHPPPFQLNDTPSPELFDQECDNDEEVSGFHCSSERMNSFFPNSHDTNPAISANISTLSPFTNSTDSGYEIPCSEYSFDISSSESGYLNPPGFENHYPVNGELQAFIPPAEFADPLPYLSPFNPAGADGTMGLNPNFLVDDCSTAMQQTESVTCVDPAALSAHVPVISDVEAQMAPATKTFECPHCPFCKSETHVYL